MPLTLASQLDVHDHDLAETLINSIRDLIKATLDTTEDPHLVWISYGPAPKPLPLDEAASVGVDPDDLDPDEHIGICPNPDCYQPLDGWSEAVIAAHDYTVYDHGHNRDDEWAHTLATVHKCGACAAVIDLTDLDDLRI